MNGTPLTVSDTNFFDTDIYLNTSELVERFFEGVDKWYFYNRVYIKSEQYDNTRQVIANPEIDGEEYGAFIYDGASGNYVRYHYDDGYYIGGSSSDNNDNSDSSDSSDS